MILCGAIPNGEQLAEMNNTAAQIQKDVRKWSKQESWLRDSGQSPIKLTNEKWDSQPNNLSV